MSRRVALTLMVVCIIGVYVTAGAAVYAAQDFNTQDIDVSPCIKEVYVRNDTVHVGWTTPPCNIGLNPRNTDHHNAIRHAVLPMICGQAILFTHPTLAVPVADTLSIKCHVQARTN